MTANPLLTARDVAERLGVSTGALLRWTRAGDVPAVKLPSGAVRYRPEAIEAWLDEREMGAAGREAPTPRANRALENSVRDTILRGANPPPRDAALAEEEPR